MGVLFEGVQYVMPTRTFNWYDVVANACGVSFFMVVWILLSHRRTQTHTDFLGLATDTHGHTQTFIRRTPPDKKCHRFAKRT